MDDLENLLNTQSYFPLFEKDFVPPEILMFRKLNTLIDLNFKKNRTSSFYAQQLGVSTKVANQRLALCCGKTIKKLLQERIFQEAVNLIIGTNMNMKEIAYELDMCDPGHFGRYVKRMVNCTPKQLRVRYQSKLKKSNDEN